MHRSDTDTKVQNRYDEAIRKMSDEDKFLRGMALTHFSRSIVWETTKTENPQASLQELKRKFAEKIYF